ncbi:homeobox-leucine zipper protein HOX11-like [Lycium ferocissimum]|uniref:homeobox-leucine zipper protein HOX11-like n=1 Tax=Lycium ferocissimum TaxID=112874 RepID=UPI0028163F41|nr:homeobox-leucine zipper protein HOX11-like [Lycium ferocissimum]
MELGLSLGDTNTTRAAASSKSFLSNKNNIITSSSSDQQKDSKKMKNTPCQIGFCMALGVNSSSGRVLQEQDDENQEENDDDEENTSEEGNINSTNNTPVQLDLLPLVPVPAPRRNLPQSLHWSSDNGSSENGSSGNGGLPAARGFDVNRLPAAGMEEVSSPNSVASSFRMDFGLFKSCVNIIGSKRNSESAGGNDPERASSRASDEDENGVNTRKKLRLSKEQSAYLEESFKEHHTLNPKQKLALAKQLNLRPRQVEVWFQNRRARTKLKQTEVDCEYLKRCCETLTEENRRLHKELQELRALKTSNPFYMQLPATTLTMCPSCERVATTTTAAAPPPVSAAGTTTTTTSKAPPTTTTSDTIPKAIPFLNSSRPRFFPFATTNNNPNHPHQSAAS